MAQKMIPKEARLVAAPLLKQFSVLTTTFATNPTRIYKIPQSWARRAKNDPMFAKFLAWCSLAWVATGGRLRIRHGHAIVFHPRWVYDVAAFFNWIANWLTGTATFCLNVLPLQTSPNWATDPTVAPDLLAKLPNALPVEKLTLLKTSVQKITDAFAWPTQELHMMQLFDSLPPASPEQLIGRAWRGRVVRTGRFLDLPDMFMIQPARLLGFKWGKRYLTPYIGDPLCYTFFDRVHIPQPLWGNVGMHSISFRGRPCATMAYDHSPWHDYFAVLDDGIESGRLQLLGLWCHREKCGGWFTLTQLPDVDVA